MIFMTIINAFFGLLQTVLGVLPNVAPIPVAVSTGGDWALAQVSSVISVLNVVFSPALMSGAVLIIVGLFVWEWVYGSVMWVVRKIPLVNLK